MDMQPEKLGKVLGIGARVAAKTIRDRAVQAQAASGAKAAATAAGASATRAPAAPPAKSSARDGSRSAGVAARPTGRNAGTTASQAAAQGGKRLARGAGRFGAAMVGPFARAGGILALQVTGVFFGLFGAFFLSHAAQTLHAAGRHDRHGQVYLGLGLVFAWFTVSSFWRARQKSKSRA